MESTNYEERKGNANLNELNLGLQEISEEGTWEWIREPEDEPEVEITTESPEVIKDLILAARVEAKLVKIYPCVSVTCEDGIITADVEAPLLWEDRLIEEFRKAGKSVSGVKDVRVHILPDGMRGLG
jgi:hypothetical protein